MRTYSKLTTCAITVVCLIFTQLNSGMLAQDNASSPRIAPADNEPPSSSDHSTNGQSGDVPTPASNVSESLPVTQTATPQTTPTDSNKKQGKSIKKWILIGAAAAAAITTILLIKKSEPQPQVSIGMPSVGGPE